MSTKKKMAKPASVLTEDDLLASPIWEWAFNEIGDGPDDELLDETYVWPLDVQSIPGGDSTYIVAADLNLANGMVLPGALEVSFDTGRLGLWQPLTLFWQGVYLGDFDPHPNTVRFLESATGLSAADIFPIVWKSRLCLHQLEKCVGGVVSNSMSIGPHPSADVLSGENID